MRYEAYRRAVDRAALATGGRVESLAGGYYGVTLDAPSHLPGVRIVLALDLDAAGAPEWLAWSEREDGEQCWISSDHGGTYAVVLGVFRPSEYRALRPSAVALLGAAHH